MTLTSEQRKERKKQREQYREAILDVRNLRFLRSEVMGILNRWDRRDPIPQIDSMINLIQGRITAFVIQDTCKDRHPFKPELLKIDDFSVEKCNHG